MTVAEGSRFVSESVWTVDAFRSWPCAEFSVSSNLACSNVHGRGSYSEHGATKRPGCVICSDACSESVSVWRGTFYVLAAPISPSEVIFASPVYGARGFDRQTLQMIPRCRFQRRIWSPHQVRNSPDQRLSEYPPKLKAEPPPRVVRGRTEGPDVRGQFWQVSLATWRVAWPVFSFG